MRGYSEAIKTNSEIQKVVDSFGIDDPQLHDSALLDVLNYLRTVETHCSMARELLITRRLHKNG